MSEEIITPVKPNKISNKAVIHNLFPTPVGCYTVDHKLTKKEHSFLINQPQRNNMGNTTSVDNKILNNKELSTFKKALEQKLSAYFNEVYSPKHQISLRITQSWVNYTKKGQYHHKHRHPNSFVSGVYYIESTELDKIYFYNSHPANNIKIPPNTWNIWNSESWWFEATKGDLFLFPSTLEHMVETVSAEDTRISLSFNTFPVGIVGEENDLTLLELT